MTSIDLGNYDSFPMWKSKNVKQFIKDLKLIDLFDEQKQKEFSETASSVETMDTYPSIQIELMMIFPIVVETIKQMVKLINDNVPNELKVHGKISIHEYIKSAFQFSAFIADSQKLAWVADQSKGTKPNIPDAGIFYDIYPDNIFSRMLKHKPSGVTFIYQYIVCFDNYINYKHVVGLSFPFIISDINKDFFSGFKDGESFKGKILKFNVVESENDKFFFELMTQYLEAHSDIYL